LKIPAEKPKGKNKMSVTEQSAREREREREREKEREHKGFFGNSKKQRSPRQAHSRDYAATTSQCSAPHASITNPAPPRNSEESPNPSFYVSE
jgi:hypothetical protein